MIDAAAIRDRFKARGFIVNEAFATALQLVLELDKPLLVEGPAGVGKTESAKVLAESLDTRLIRLQCYEGLDALTALYEWNYPRQMLHIRLSEAEILKAYSLRWSIEVYFKEIKQHLGFLKEQSGRYEVAYASVHLAAIRYLLLFEAMLRNGKLSYGEMRDRQTGRILVLTYALLLWELFRALIDGALENLARQLGRKTIDAVSAAISRACASPSAPVQALAQPLLTTMARIDPLARERCSRDRRIGAAAARLVVNTPAAEAGPSETTSARSGRPFALMPQATPAARNPPGAAMPPASGS